MLRPDFVLRIWSQVCNRICCHFAHNLIHKGLCLVRDFVRKMWPLRSSPIQNLQPQTLVGAKPSIAQLLTQAKAYGYKSLRHISTSFCRCAFAKCLIKAASLLLQRVQQGLSPSTNPSYLYGRCYPRTSVGNRGRRSRPSQPRS
jgi:hypothetical protein